MSEIKFSNLIFEEQKEVLAQNFTAPRFDLNNPKPVSNTQPNITLNLPRTNLLENKNKEYYISKINTPGVNLDLLKQEILTQPLLDYVKTNLLDMIEKRKEFPDKIAEYKDKFFELDPKTKAGFGVSGSGTSSPSQNQTLIIDSDSATDVDPATLSKLKLESIYSGSIEKDPSIKTRGMKPSLESIGSEQTQELASLEASYKETLKKINILDKVYAELVRNPTNLNLGAIINAHSSSKFVKLAEKDIKEADERIEDYYNNEMDYAPYGTALEHPEETKNIPTKDIKVHSQSNNENPKFRKIN